MQKIVVTRPVPEEGLAGLREQYDVYVHESDPYEPPLDESVLAGLAQDADALITMLSDPVTARVLEAAPRLHIVAQYAVGFDNIDVEAAGQRGIVVTNTPGVLTDATADFAFTLLLAAARRIVEADRFVREGRFRRWETMLLFGMDLKGKTLGIVGMGRIGRAMARRAAGFGMQIVYFSRNRVDPEVEAEVGARFVSFDELLAASHVVSLHCPLNAESRGLFDAVAFRRMRPGAVLINTARGPVVDEAALVEALDSGHLGAAGLDVFENEPAIHPGLLTQERVVLAPHIASAAVETRTEMARMCAEAVHAVLSGAVAVPYRVA